MTAHGAQTQKPIDRKALVSRHNVVLTQMNADSPLQVGNGEFAFGMDVTGLQSFVPFNTMSQWGWHSSPVPAGQKIEDFEGQVWETHGRPVRYPMPDPNHPELSEWLAANPHRINLGRIGFALRKRDGSLAVQTDIQNPVQTLDLWSGIVTSRFEVEGVPVTVKTACHPTLDLIAVRVNSPLLQEGRIAAFVSCPGNNPVQFANYVGDDTHPAKLEELRSERPNQVNFLRPLDNDSYSVSLAWQGNAALQRPQGGIGPKLNIISAMYGTGDKWMDVKEVVANAIHDERLSITVNGGLGPDPAPGVVKSLRVIFTAGRGGEQTATAAENHELVIDPAPELRRLTLQPATTDTSFEFVCAFSPKTLPTPLPTAQSAFAACQQAWPAYWKTGGAIDLSSSTDPRWKELERRIVLSQYLMKVNEAGSNPPQESGLVNNGWYGRWHMEMIWWHATHWALWNHWSELDKSIDIYKRLLPGATKLAKSQGYEGARWPKCIGPDLHEWPHEIHALLTWQQPHPIFFAELDYRAHPTKATLKKWRSIVEATADFLASFAFYDASKKQYVLGPPIVLVSENTNSKTTQNPTFELGYWRFGLRTAQDWRKRLGLATPPRMGESSQGARSPPGPRQGIRTPRGCKGHVDEVGIRAPRPHRRVRPVAWRRRGQEDHVEHPG